MAPFRSTRSKTQLLPAAAFLQLSPSTRRPAPPRDQRSRSPRSSPFDEKWLSEGTFEEFVERDENDDPLREYVDTEDIPDFGVDGGGLGEPLFNEEVHTHKTVRSGGYVTVNAIGDEDLEKKREKRKKTERARRLGIRRRRAKRSGGGARRGPDGRFVKTV